MITPQIEESINKSVLCWLATSSSENIPNVSPKEVFLKYDQHHIIIANIASPQSVKNIKQNNQVCLSFIDILIQKGYQLKGKASIITEQNEEYTALKKELEKITEGKYPFKSITKIRVEKYKEIIAPSYLLYPEATVESRVESAKKAYGLL